MGKMDLIFNITDNVNFYRNNSDKELYYAEFDDVDGARVFAPLDSDEFKSFLLVKSNELTNGDSLVEPDGAVKKIRCFLNYNKSYTSTDIFVRIAGNLSEGIEYDLQNDEQLTVKITAEGWDLSPKKQRFVVPKIALPQVMPIETTKSPLELLKPFVNVEGDMYVLFVVWLIQAFSLGTHYAQWISASKGCGKTTLCRVIKRLLDPCSFDVTPIPDKKDDLHVLLYNSFLCCFDNLSGNISTDISNVFCGAITGTAIAKRSLYTDVDLKMATLHNTIVLNGVDISVTRDDFLERMLLIKLRKISSAERRTDAKIWGDFTKLLPEILGSIFNTLSSAMNEIKIIQENNITRIGDAFVEMLAIAQALGISQEKFRQIFDDNKEALKRACSMPPLVEAVKETMTSLQGRKLQGSANTVFKQIYKNYSGDKTALPQSASHFTRQLDKEYANLTKNGFRVNIDDTGAQGTQVAIIKRK